MNPYSSNPDEIPASDRYADSPFYGRYFPKPNDFRVDLQHINSHSEDSLKYWASIVARCNESAQIFPAGEGGRDVFALGSVIIKSSHLHQEMEIDYTYADTNEVQSISIAKTVLKGVRVPEIFFSGRINGRQVLVQERLQGVGLNIAWPYLSGQQRDSFKTQARELLRQLNSVTPPGDVRTRTHVAQDQNILTNGRIRPIEADILFSSNIDDDMGLMHNDFTRSNCIVNDDKIVGLIDWEMAGYFGWKTAAEVHRKIRSPQREHFAKVDLSEEELLEIMSWNDLYDKELEKN
ncbi:unnamed protein product [Clonostachys solani]|uniref:Aminoglycoside phosphotransferase domain-containing protein n=1 Tax=Clonostachys solani TaxID=160281 RepID=A0A9N9Z4G2_9HYPO|nr:unnamed protein product [Clonostachys solani]